MAIPASKSELISAIRDSYTKLSKEISNIPESMSRDRTLPGEISLCDLVAYQLGWGRLLTGWYESGEKGIMPVLPSEKYKWNQLGDLAKSFYEEYSGYDLTTLLNKFDEMVTHVLSIIDKHNDEGLYTIGIYKWTGDKWPLGRWINVNTSSPYKSARAKLRTWKKSVGIALL